MKYSGNLSDFPIGKRLCLRCDHLIPKSTMWRLCDNCRDFATRNENNTVMPDYYTHGVRARGSRTKMPIGKAGLATEKETMLD